jgi:hypothetical protein
LCSQFEQYQLDNDRHLQESVEQNHQFLLDLRMKLQVTNTFRQEVVAKILDLEARLPKSPMCNLSHGDATEEHVFSIFSKQTRFDKGEGSQDENDFVKRDNKFYFPISDYLGFQGDNPIKWICKCNSYFIMHQIPHIYKSHITTIQFMVQVVNDIMDTY